MRTPRACRDAPNAHLDAPQSRLDAPRRLGRGLERDRDPERERKRGVTRDA